MINCLYHTLLQKLHFHITKIVLLIGILIHVCANKSVLPLSANFLDRIRGEVMLLRMSVIYGAESE